MDDVEFYDDHCYVNFMNEIWYIVSKRPGMLQVLSIDNPGRMAIINIDNCDWDSYCAEAVSLLSSSRRYH